jgi:serine/threonine protein kinase
MKMTFEPGTKLGAYEIVESIGAGGMGQVYRARDSRLGRDVAIKVSVQKFSEHFEREARVVASLNHPNVCTLHDVGPNYLVMELVEGATLAERIKQGPVPLDEALRIAKQIADALDAAHERGIVHRDLKPGNVMIKPDGSVKVLDFGLAKMGGTPTVMTEDSPTITGMDTQAGLIMGTAAYMSPEQAKGKSVDKRADIWAFGVVLYEMLTGKRLFPGETTTEILAAVLKEEPHWDQVPPQVHRLLRRCLEKDPQQRLRHIGDVMALVDESPMAATPGKAKKKWLWPAAAAVLVAAAVVLWASWRSQPNLLPVRFDIQPTEKANFITGGFPQVSPNGRWIVFPALGSDGITRLWLRALDNVEVRPLAGTEAGNTLPPPPFWSPDSRFIAFSSNPGSTVPGQLKKLDISGGPPQTICEISAPVPGGAWNKDGVILFGAVTNNTGLKRVSSAGGIPTPVTVLDQSHQETAHRYVQFLPDGRHFIYHRTSRNPEYTGIYVGSIDVKPEEQSLKPLLLTDRQAVFAVSIDGSNGHLLFLRETTLFAQTFDPGRLELKGEAVPVSDQVGSFAPASAALFSVSETGVLAYRVGTGGSSLQLVWADLSGKITGTIGERSSYGNPAISPHGTRVAVTQLDPQKGNSNIWVLDTARGTSTRLTFTPGRDEFAVWSPDGKRIVFASNRSGHFDLYEKPADGSSDERLLLKTDYDKRPSSWSRDGRYLLYAEIDPKTQDDLWVLPLESSGNSAPVAQKPVLFLRTQFREYGGRFSPDSRFVAYQSNESGNSEIYVRPFSADKIGDSASGGRWMVSKGGGGNPRWRADGKQLFYNFQLEQWGVDITTEKAFQAGISTRLFNVPAFQTAPDVTSDGKRFLYVTFEGATTTQTPFTVVLNWQAALKK